MKLEPKLKLKLKPKPKRRRVPTGLLLLGVLALLNALVFGAYTVRRATQSRSLTARLEERRNELKRLRALNQEVKRRQQIARENAVDTRRFYSQIVGRRDERLLPLLQELDDLANELKLDSDRLNFDVDEVKDSRLVRFRISMPVQGAYGQIVAFLDRLEHSSHFLIVERLALDEGAGPGGQQRKLTLVFSTYFLGDAGRAG